MRRSFLLLALVGSIVLATTGVVLAQATTGGDSSNQRSGGKAPLQKEDKASIKGQYIVVLNDNVSRADDVAKKHAADEGFTPDFVYENALKGYATKLSDAQLDKVRSKPEVKFVSPDQQVEAFQKTDSTTQKDSSSKKGATSQSLVPISGDSAPTGVTRINAATSTQAAQPSDVNVAVIDTGIDLSHSDLTAVNGKNAVRDTDTKLCVNTVSSAQDDNGHGTHVSGTIGAKNNGSGVVGVAPGTKLYAVKVLNSSGSGTSSQVACGIDWVTANAKALNIKVASMSLGGGGSNDNKCDSNTGTYTGIDAIHKAICSSTYAGITYVVAAGNSAADLANTVPAAYPEVLTVTAMSDSDGKPGGTGGTPSCRSGEQDDKYASFSNYAGSSVDQNHTIAGPGVCIKSTWPQSLGDKSGYNTISGTSMATPHQSGTVALCIGSGGTPGPCAGKTPAQIIRLLTSNAQAYSTGTNGYGFTGDPFHSPVSGKFFGYLTYAQDYASGSDTTAPIVSSVNPADQATEVGRASNVTATFSEDMDSSTLSSSTFTLAPVDSFGNVGQPITATVKYESATNTVTLDPSTNLQANTNYTATIEGGTDPCDSPCAKDKAGNPLAADKVWFFTTTSDVTPPTVSTVTPSAGARDVPLNTNVTATFSEDMDSSSLTETGVVKLVRTSDGAPVDAKVSYTTNTVTLDPSTNLQANTNYTATIEGGTDPCDSPCAKDKAGNPLAEDYVWSFTTTSDATPPKVIEYSPTGWGNVSRDTNVTVKFSEDVNKDTVTRDTFMLARGGYEPTPETKITSGTTVRYDPTTRTATLDPYGSSTTKLARCARYTGKVTSGVTDNAGNPAVEIVWTFKTRGC